MPGISKLRVYLALLIFVGSPITFAQDPQQALRIPLRQIVISADFDALGRTITQEKLLTIAQQKRRTLPEYVSYADLLEIKDLLTRYMRDQGYKFHLAKLPAQKLSRGYVSYSITTVTLDEVSIKNTTKIKDKTIRKSFEDLLKQPLYQPDIDSALAPLQDNPLLKVFAYYSRGRASNSVRLNIKAEPKRDFQFSTGIDNYGTSSIGEQRLLAQVQWQNPSLAMDKLDLTLLVSNGEQLNTYGQISYLRPILGIDNRVRLSASNNVFQLGESLATLELDGDATILSASFERDITPQSSYKQTLSILGESRETKYGGFLQEDLNESSSLTELKWQLNRSQNPAVRHYASLSYAQGNVELGQQVEREFSRVRLNYNSIITPTNMLSSKFASQFVFSLRSQFAPERVSSFDQFALTGISAVRALQPGQYSVDTGYLVKGEWRLPRLLSFGQNAWRVMPFLSFDYGQGEKLDQDGEELETGALTGLATGAILSHKSGLTSKLTLASAIANEIDIADTESTGPDTRELDSSGVLFELLYRW